MARLELYFPRVTAGPELMTGGFARHCLCQPQRAELVRCTQGVSPPQEALQQLVVKRAVEALAVAVLPWRARALDHMCLICYTDLK